MIKVWNINVKVWLNFEGQFFFQDKNKTSFVIFLRPGDDVPAGLECALCQLQVRQKSVLWARRVGSAPLPASQMVENVQKKTIRNKISRKWKLSEMQTLSCAHYRKWKLSETHVLILFFLSTFFIFAVQTWNAKGKGSPRGVLFLICSIPGLARSDENAMNRAKRASPTLATSPRLSKSKAEARVNISRSSFWSVAYKALMCSWKYVTILADPFGRSARASWNMAKVLPGRSRDFFVTGASKLPGPSPRMCPPPLPCPLNAPTRRHWSCESLHPPSSSFFFFFFLSFFSLLSDPVWIKSFSKLQCSVSPWLLLLFSFDALLHVPGKTASACFVSCPLKFFISSSLVSLPWVSEISKNYISKNLGKFFRFRWKMLGKCSPHFFT